MAEFCLDCWNRLNETHYTEQDFIISNEPDLCEGCSEWKPVLITMRRSERTRRHKRWYDLKTAWNKRAAKLKQKRSSVKNKG